MCFSSIFGCWLSFVLFEIWISSLLFWSFIGWAVSLNVSFSCLCIDSFSSVRRDWLLCDAEVFCRCKGGSILLLVKSWVVSLFRPSFDIWGIESSGKLPEGKSDALLEISCLFSSLLLLICFVSFPSLAPSGYNVSFLLRLSVWFLGLCRGL